jgi:hypothetical protein
VTKLRVLPDWRLVVSFVDKTTGEVHLKKRVFGRKAKGTFYEALRDPEVFEMAYLEYGAVTWPGEIDLAPDAMHDEIKAHGRWVLK